MPENELSTNEKLFMIYISTIETEKKALSKSKFNDISIKDLHMIHTISIKGNPSVSEIAKILFISKQATAKRVNKLEKLGYIQKTINKQDKRSVKVTLTHKGKLLCRLHNHAHNEYIKSLLQDCSPNDKKTLDNIINHIIENIKKGR